MSFFFTQGTMNLSAPSYVERQADRELLQGLLEGDFCYVLTSRQMGKSSLMVRTAQRLRERGCSVVILDLQGLGTNLTPEQFYDGLVVKTGRQLGLEDRLDDFWLDNERIGPVQRLFTALQEVVVPNLPAVKSPDASPTRLVLFVDEIDMVRSLKFDSEEFFAAIRESYNARSTGSEPTSIVFALLGVATPAELIRNPNVTPFSIGRRIELTDFTAEEALALARGLGRPVEEAQALMQRILWWTNGHPYLTHRLCEVLASDPLLEHPTDINRLCEELFLSRRACDRDPNLLFVRESLLRTGPCRASVLRLYQQVRNRKHIADDESDPVNNALRLSGVVRVDNGVLAVRNRIYQRVFDNDWVQQTMESFGESDTISVAVLPFVDLSVEADDYLADGLTDEIINALGLVSGLRVASRTSSSVFKGKGGDVRQIGAQLGVSILLEGNVRRLGRRVRVNTQLVSVSDGKRLSSASFKYSIDDLHLIRDEICRTVVMQLKAPVAGSPGCSPVQVVQPPDREAYHLYLKGRYYWNRRNETSIGRSVSYFEEALARDTDYAAAYAGAAAAYIILGVYNYRPPVEVFPRAKEYAIRALEIDENLAEAHEALGCVSSVFDWDWARAEKSFRRAISLNPSYANARHWYGINCLTPLGRHEEALAELRVAQEVDPLCIRVSASIGLALHLAGRNDEAIAHCRYTIELDETFWLTYLFLGCAHLQKGDFHNATRAFQSSVDLSQGDAGALSSLGYCYALQNRKVEASRILEGLINLGRSRYVPASEIATIYAGLRQMDLAKQWMDKAHQEKSFRLIYLRVDPRFAEFRGEA